MAQEPTDVALEYPSQIRAGLEAAYSCSGVWRAE